MNIDDVVELDLTFAKLAERQQKKAFMAGFNFGFEEALSERNYVSGEMLEQAWEDYRNGKQS